MIDGIIMTLADLRDGESTTLIFCPIHQLSSMGFVRGKTITRLGAAMTGDPIRFKILDYTLAIRKSEASRIHVGDENDRLATQCVDYK